MMQPEHAKNLPSKLLGLARILKTAQIQLSNLLYFPIF